MSYELKMQGAGNGKRSFQDPDEYESRVCKCA